MRVLNYGCAKHHTPGEREIINLIKYEDKKKLNQSENYLLFISRSLIDHLISCGKFEGSNFGQNTKLIIIISNQTEPSAACKSFRRKKFCCKTLKIYCNSWRMRSANFLMSYIQNSLKYMCVLNCLVNKKMKNIQSRLELKFANIKMIK